ncbi:MAG: site-2 protease family protein [Candidatus Obscuribacterales bacterium]|nr:site-2 protease family protein [Candidatus Obscuribacterales bacterium]
MDFAGLYNTVSGALPSVVAALPGILAMVGALMFLILIHEFGHWIVARLLGFRTPVFSIGFGKRNWSLVLGKFWDTEFRLSPILLGGYVSIPELGDETSVKDYEGDAFKGFTNHPYWKKMAVTVAGVTMNFLFAIVCITLMFSIMGQPRMDVSATKIGGFDPKVTLAKDAGLQPDDVFVSVDGKPVKMPEDLLKAVQSRKNQPTKIVVSRNGKPVEVEVTPNAEGRIGIQLGVDAERSYERMGLWTATKTGVSKSCEAVVMMFKGIGMMIGFVEKPAGLPDQALEVHGVVGIVQMGGQAFDRGLFDFFWLVAMMSINLAIMNILPIPLLDGGHVVFFTIEKVTGKPVPMEARERIYKFFGMLLIMLTVWGLFNDFARPIQPPK